MRGLKLHHWIALGMGLGAGIGVPLNLMAENGTLEVETVREVAHAGEQIGRLFLRLLQMVVVPLIVSSLITGVTGLGHPKKLGQLGARTFGYYLLTSLLGLQLRIAKLSPCLVLKIL